MNQCECYDWFIASIFFSLGLLTFGLVIAALYIIYKLVTTKY